MLGLQYWVKESVSEDFKGEEEVLGCGGLRGTKPAEKSDC